MWILWVGMIGADSWWCAPLAFVAYKLVSNRALAILDGRAPKPPAARLLLLRIFGARKRTERLMEQLSTRWRYIGPIHLIAGTDLATANLNPVELYAFLAFRFRRLYVKDTEDLARRLASIDCAPDRDGRYRVNDFFCFDDTWKTTLQQLIGVSDVVLLDARGFSAGHAGVVFELTRLMHAKRIGDTLIAIDETTDERALRSALDDAWHTACESKEATVHLFRVSKRGDAVERLVAATCNLAALRIPSVLHG
jgi:hypothetical protein